MIEEIWYITRGAITLESASTFRFALSCSHPRNSPFKLLASLSLKYSIDGLSCKASCHSSENLAHCSAVERYPAKTYTGPRRSLPLSSIHTCSISIFHFCRTQDGSPDRVAIKLRLSAPSCIEMD